MSRPFSQVFFPKRSQLLWLAWLRARQPLRPAGSGTTTFLWLVLVLAALGLRPDLAGVTSLVRSLGLSDACYYCLLHFFHPVGPHCPRVAPIFGALSPAGDLVQFPLLHSHGIPAKTAL
jgi:hypothetical protein